VNGTVNGVSMPAYTYDANGNMQTDGTRSFTWTSFNMPLVISKTATAGSPGSGNASFNYGAEHQRVQQVWSSGGQNSTTIYLNEFDFEKVIDGSGSTYKHYVKAGDRIVASVVRTSGGTTVSYILPDHLASTSVVTDASGAVTDRMAYDPWGDRRFATGSVGASDPTNTIQPTSINRGYTGHEMLDQGNLGLIHMNGRVYDPTLGRFISADPFIQDPYATRSFNRYAYVWNGPLDSTDPSGFVCIAPCTVTVTGSSAIGVGFAGLASSASAMWGWSSANWGWARVTTLLMRTPTALVVTGFLKPSTLNANEAEELAKMHALQDKMLADLVETQADQAQQALSESSNGEADSKKGPPNPNGRNGGQAHQDGVKQAEQELRDKYADDPDVEVRTEVRVRTPGGDKENRFIDVAAVDKKTGQVIEGVQVGKETQAGNPVAREQRAINDISRASPSTDISFRPYNR
jgi:RHS repeat-associated protein